MTRTCRQRVCISIASGAPAIAYAAAAEVVPRAFDVLALRWWVTHLMLLVVLLMAYLASSLPKWAKWEDGSRLDRLTITQGVLVSMLAGFIAWLLSYYYANLHEAVCFVAAVLAAYGGDAYLLKQMERMFGRYDAPIDKARNE